MIFRGRFRFHVAQRRLLEDLVLRMIQRPAPGTLDLELCKPTRAGEKSFAVTASEFFQHLQIPFAESPFPWAIKNPLLAGYVIAFYQIARPLLNPSTHGIICREQASKEEQP